MIYELTCTSTVRPGPPIVYLDTPLYSGVVSPMRGTVDEFWVYARTMPLSLTLITYGHTALRNPYMHGIWHP